MARYAVIGLGRFGMTVANILSESGMDVIAIDKDQELVDEVSGRVSYAICMDSTDEAALRSQNLNEADAVIIGIGSNIQESILTAAILRKIGVGIIYAKVENRLHGRILELIGVQNILLPEEIVGTQLAKTLISKNVREYISLSSGHVVMEMLAPREFVGKDLQELALPTSRGVNIIAIKYNSLSVTEDGRNVIEKKMNDMPGANDTINEGDILIMMGPKGNVDKLIYETTIRKD
ncbi:MAG: TrkA family potassium uptake protein [Candidatus Cloacimonetes bacterium]|jgi:trk system potassium uptake protein TrkA|nr:TrkA family potassium uptake protein [Candidatus Cloacimonadota bacterium]MDY0299144.1 TrkA family potassium uptake protein [Candidatus Cloacimonadaceae bacterium]MCB5279084.1 TrkA family potassium uptake protein [Candidatus Cloacimonadota bacterium]MCK9332642.1 TrkA family potassium uptake protein [Candidatus Cloacimonadota bacterium]MDD2210900.1 TrkA family potassium uptake protein [Candidatus Cloacimonadota bacterium]